MNSARPLYLFTSLRNPGSHVLMSVHLSHPESLLDRTSHQFWIQLVWLGLNFISDIFKGILILWSEHHSMRTTNVKYSHWGELWPNKFSMWIAKAWTGSHRQHSRKTLLLSILSQYMPLNLNKTRRYFVPNMKTHTWNYNGQSNKAWSCLPLYETHKIIKNAKKTFSEIWILPWKRLEGWWPLLELFCSKPAWGAASIQCI